MDNEKFKNIPGKTLNRIRGAAEKMVNKAMAPSLRKMNLEQQVRAARSLMKQIGIREFRANLLSDGGLPEDIKDLYKQGKSKEEIKAYYWECIPFRNFWLEIECTEDMLDLIIKQKGAEQ